MTITTHLKDFSHTECILEAIGRALGESFLYLGTWYPRKRPKPTLHLDGCRGSEVGPRDFARTIMRECISGVDPADLDLLALGPNAVEDLDSGATAEERERALDAEESYWVAWDTILDHAIVTMPGTGDRYTLWQDGDLWLIPEGMSHCDRHGWVWEEDDSDECDLCESDPSSRRDCTMCHADCPGR